MGSAGVKADHIADTVRTVSFHLAAPKEWQGIQLLPGQQVMSVEYDGETSRFYVVIMAEHIDGTEGVQ